VGSVARLRVATPLASRVAEPSDVVPEKKLTIPVGVPVVLEATVSVKVTVAPASACAEEEVSVSLTVAFETPKAAVAVLGA
jgi:hypothetical protein